MIESGFYGLIVGLSLGLTGGGGSIFAVPFLVFGLNQEFRSAVAISLAVVGLTSLFGASLQARRGHVLWGAGAVLGIGGIFGAPLGALIGSNLSENVSLILFAVLMVVIGVRMLALRQASGEIVESWIACSHNADGTPEFTSLCAIKLAAAGAVTGVLSGIFGVGGGFLVVPALLVVTQIRIERALATSLVAIFLISMSGFAFNFSHLDATQVPMSVTFLVGAGVGMTLGIQLKKLIPSDWLAKIFGIATILMAVYIIGRTLL